MSRDTHNSVISEKEIKNSVNQPNKVRPVKNDPFDALPDEHHTTGNGPDEPNPDEKLSVPGVFSGLLKPCRQFVLWALFFFLFAAGDAAAQVLSVYDINTSDYPVVEARYMYLDGKGRQVFSMDRNRFAITENGRQAELMDLKNPRRREPRKLSVVLAFDVSGSMEGERLAMAKAAASEFVDLLPLEMSECAISSFDHLNYLNSDFTHSQKRLQQAIDSLRALGGTNYNSGFISPFSGALKVARDGQFKKVVVFLTDGLGEGDRERIIRMAQQQDVTVYPVTIGMSTPDILRQVAMQTGGRYFGQVEGVERAKAIYNEILLTAQSVQAGTLRWRSPNSCNDVVNTVFEYKGETFRTRYRLSADQRVRLRIEPRLISLDASDSGSVREIKLEAVNADFSVRELQPSHKGRFATREPQNFPLQVPADSTRKLVLAHKPGGGSGYTDVAVVNDRCPDYHIYIKSGDGSRNGLKVLQPNGGEVFTPGTQASIRWEGVAQRDSVSILHSPDSGNRWEPVARASGGEYSWKVPADTGSRHLIRIDQDEHGSGPSAMQPLMMPGGQDYSAHNARFVRDGQYIVTMEDDHSLKLWKGNSGDYLRTFSLHHDWIYDATTGPDDRLLVTASDDGSARIVDLETWRVKQKLQVNTWGINHALFAPDGKRVITAGDDGAIRVWNSNTGEHLYGILAHRGWVMDIALNRQGTRLVSAGDDKLLRLWDLGSGRHLGSMVGHINWIYDVEFSPDGSHIVSASKDSTFRIWDASDGRLLRTIRRHNGKVYSASYSPDGSLLVTASRDGTLRLWESDGMKQLSVLEAGPGRWFHEARFGPDGQRVIATTSKREVRVWFIHDREPFRSDRSDNPFRIVSPIPQLQEVDFGRHYVDRPVDTLLKRFFVNSSAHPIRVEKVELDGEDRSNFRLISGYQPFTLEPGEKAPLEMAFNARSVGHKEARLVVSTPTRSVTTPVKGRGMLRRYRVPLEHVHMGSLELDETSDSVFTILENRGTSTLRLKGLQIRGPGKEHFSVQEGGGPENIYPHGRHKVGVTFSPAIRGRSNARLYFRVDHTTHSIDLMGEGLAPERIILQGRVLGEQTKEPLASQVGSYDLKTNRRIDSMLTGDGGSFSLSMNPDRTYRVVAEKEGYLPGNINIDLTGPATSDTLQRNIYLSSIEPGSSVTLNNIFFEYAKARITPSSMGEIRQVARFLRRNDSIRIELAGHTDSIGTRRSNLVLSRERARAVRNSLIELGVDAGRIEAKGYGETRPVADNTTPAGRARNRRVVFTVLEE